MFDVNQELVAKARSILLERNNIYWVIGGACTGKSTICRAIAESKEIKLYDRVVQFWKTGRRSTLMTLIFCNYLYSAANKEKK